MTAPQVTVNNYTPPRVMRFPDLKIQYITETYKKVDSYEAYPFFSIHIQTKLLFKHLS